MYVITSACIKCGTCSGGCPITPNCDGHTCYIQCGTGMVCHARAIIEGETQYIITDKCTDCGRCALFCPVGAIKPGPASAAVQEENCNIIENEHIEKQIIL